MNSALGPPEDLADIRAALPLPSIQEDLGAGDYRLPVLSHKLAAKPDNIAAWEASARQLTEAMAASKGPAATAHLILRLLVTEGLLSGPSAALARMIGRFSENVEALSKVESADDVGVTLSATGWFDAAGDDVSDALARALQLVSAKDSLTFRVFILKIIALLDFDHHTPMDWVQRLMTNLIFPAMDEGVKDSQRADVALILELKVYSAYVKRIETSEHFVRSYERIKRPLISSGHLFKKHLRPFSVTREKVPHVGFYLTSQAMLAHTKNLITFLNGLSKLPQRPIIPIIYVDGMPSDELTEAMAPLGVTLRYMRRSDSDSPLSVWVKIRETSQADNVAAMVFVSNVLGMSFATAMGVAPVHIWWSMKYRGLALPDLHGYMEMAHLFGSSRVVDGTTWLNCHAALTDLVDTTIGRAEARLAMAIQPTWVALMCLGREEKLLNRGYARALGAIMRANPLTVYFWSGRSQPPEFLAWLEEEGIADRCGYLSWAKTKVCAQVMDVYLDSFPFASGHTAFEAMAAGKPIVVLLTPEALETSTASAVMPAYEGHAGTKADQDNIRRIFGEGSLLPFQPDEEAYIRHANKLIRDAAFRKAAGDAGRAFVETYMYDDIRLAESTCENILSVITQAAVA